MARGAQAVSRLEPGQRPGPSLGRRGQHIHVLGEPAALSLSEFTAPLATRQECHHFLDDTTQPPHV